jgi:hypothetical protein
VVNSHRGRRYETAFVECDAIISTRASNYHCRNNRDHLLVSISMSPWCIRFFQMSERLLVLCISHGRQGNVNKYPFSGPLLLRRQLLAGREHRFEVQHMFPQLAVFRCTGSARRRKILVCLKVISCRLPRIFKLTGSVFCACPRAVQIFFDRDSSTTRYGRHNHECGSIRRSGCGANRVSSIGEKCVVQ